MDTVEVETTAYLPPEEVYEFLLSFPRYARYSKHLKRIRGRGDGGPGTEYELTFAWWRLSYTAHSEVTEVHPPERIDWRLTKDVDATGCWLIEPIDPPEGREHATRVVFRVRYHPDSAEEDQLPIPAFLSLDGLVEKIRPKIEAEAERVVRRIVADLEGEKREVDLEIRTS